MASHDDVDDDDCTEPIYENGRYYNPWGISRDKSFIELFKFFFWTKDERKIPDKGELDKTLPVKVPDLSEFSTSPATGIRHMWIGHASSLVQFDGITLLTDPIFSDQCAPSQWWLGSKRYRPPPCRIDDLPQVDCVLISHNHYDHLDYNSILALNKRFGDQLKWYVPMGLKKWMNDCGVNNVVELSWWQEHIHNEHLGVKIVSTPCQHWCRRTPNDEDKVLWTSWCVVGPKHRFYFAGDTGYCPGFKQIGKRYGPFTLSTIPIGAYNPTEYLSPQHVNPKQAVDIHNDVLSQKSVGIHWGTFALTYEFYLEPREAIKEELQKRGMDSESFITVNHGEIIVVKGDNEIKKFSFPSASSEINRLCKTRTGAPISEEPS